MPSAVVVIDVQCALFDLIPRPYEANETIARINDLTGRARAAGVSVIFVQHEQPTGALAYGSEGWQLPANLVVKDIDDKVRKTTPDSFLRTNLTATLSAKGVNNLIICGYASEFCVDTTTRRAAALGYAVQLVADGHTTHDKEHASGKEIREHHNATLQNITSFGPRIVTVTSADIHFGD